MLIKSLPQKASLNNKGLLKPDNDTIVIENGVLSAPQPPQAVAQTSGTDEEIAAMINGYYNGTFSLEDIQAVQALGDARQCSDELNGLQIASHTAPRVYANGGQRTDYTMPKQTTIVQIIIGFDHDTLKASQDSITKALITIQMKGLLSTVANDDVASDNGSMAMNDSDTNSGGQEESQIRSYLNGNFYNAIGNLKDLVKQVVKSNCKDYSSSTITTTDDYVFLLSEYEAFGSKTKAPNNEGNHYTYYNSNSIRIKKQGQEGSGNYAGYWQLRSLVLYYSNYFCMVDKSSGSISYNYASGNIGVSPALAL